MSRLLYQAIGNDRINRHHAADACPPILLPAMNSLEIVTTLTLADWQSYQAAWAARLQAQSRLSRRTLGGIVLFALLLAVALVMLAVHLIRQYLSRLSLWAPALQCSDS